MSNLVLKIVSNKSQVNLEAEVLDNASRPHEFAEKVKTLMESGMAGCNEFLVELPVDRVAATGSITVASSGAQSVTIDGVELTGGTSFAISALTVAQIASNIADAINESSDDHIQLVSAEANAAVVSLVAKDAGLVGNLIGIAASGAASVSAANLAGGDAGDLRTFRLGR